MESLFNRIYKPLSWLKNNDISRGIEKLFTNGISPIRDSKPKPLNLGI